MIIRFGKHSAMHGHIIERRKSGHPSRWRNMRFKVRLIDGRWIDEKGRDVHDDVMRILLASYEKSLCKSLRS